MEAQAQISTLSNRELLVGVIRNNRQLLVIMLVWLFAGLYGGVLVYPVIFATIFLLRAQMRFEELLLGFWYILILSDSRDLSMEFAVTAKAFYVVTLSLFLIVDRRGFTPFNNIYLRFIPFILAAFLSLLFAEGAAGPYVQRTLSYLILILVVPNFTASLYRQDRDRFFRRLIWFAIFILGVGLLISQWQPWMVYLKYRYSGLFGNPNGLGVFCILIFFLQDLIETLRPGLIRRWEKWGLIGLIAMSLYLAGSRGSIMGLLIYLFFKYFYNISQFLGFLLFILVVVGYQLVEANFIRIVIFLNLEEYFRVDTLESGSGRIVGWSFAWQNIQKSLFVGKGLGYAGYLYEENFRELSLLGHQGNAHNSYLTFWLETGLIGLVTFMAAFVSYFLQAAKQFRIALPMLYAILFMINVESWLVASLNPFTIIVFMLIAIMITAIQVGDVAAKTENVTPLAAEPDTESGSPTSTAQPAT